MSEDKSIKLSENDKAIFEAIDKNDVGSLKVLLLEKIDVNIIDENSMTPLQHASYKGNKEIVQLLLDQVGISVFIKSIKIVHFKSLLGCRCELLRTSTQLHCLTLCWSFRKY